MPAPCVVNDAFLDGPADVAALAGSWEGVGPLPGGIRRGGTSGVKVEEDDIDGELDYFLSRSIF
jgi:hypothetical protein